MGLETLSSEPISEEAQETLTMAQESTGLINDTLRDILKFQVNNIEYLHIIYYAVTDAARDLHASIFLITRKDWARRCRAR
jgi:hypothetical protein